MIGNDIIDLKKAALDSNWKRKGYLSKLFTIKEQSLISNEKVSFNMVWRLWSMKESVYKVYIQKGGERAFIPSKIECFITSQTEGYALLNNEKYNLSTVIEKEYIYTFTNSNMEVKAFHSICNLQSDIKNEVLKKLSENYKIKKNQFSIVKDDKNIPKIMLKDEFLDIPISITHHGEYQAFSIILN